MVEYNNKKNNKNISENNAINRDYINPKINISPKIKREFKKIGKDIVFTPGKNQYQILYQKNNQEYCHIVNY